MPFMKGEGLYRRKATGITNKLLMGEDAKEKVVSGNANCLSSQVAMTNNQNSNVGVEPRKTEKVPRKKKYEPDVFFKVNGKLYQKLGKIGSGGNSEVHKVISWDCTIYSLKKIKLKDPDYPTAYGICQEIEYLNKLKGKNNIIQLIDYEVALKTLIVIHRTLREGDPTFRDELLDYYHRGHVLKVSNFKDDSNPLGNFQWNVEDVAKSVVCMIMSGPCLTGYTQTLNDWYDREIDAINEPYRPIPSGAISEGEVITQIWLLLLGGLGLGALLDVWAGHTFPVIFYLAVGGSLLSYIYSAPPLKLKQNGWIGNFALGASYISLPWWAGQALFGTLTPDIVVLTTLYSIAGLGIAIVNDFKSIEGDRAMGLQSLPVAFGLETAKWICVGAIDITQISIAGYLLGAGKPFYALALLGLIIPQVFFQFQYLLKDPIKYDVKYQASAQPFLILGLLVTALATSH